MNPLIIGSVIEGAKLLIEKFFTSKDEKEKAQLTLQQLREQPRLLQIMTNIAEAQNKSIFVSGWRPFLGWGLTICTMIAFICNILVYPLLNSFGIKVEPIDLASLLTMLGNMLGISMLHSFDKYKGLNAGLQDIKLPEPEET